MPSSWELDLLTALKGSEKLYAGSAVLPPRCCYLDEEICMPSWLYLDARRYIAGHFNGRTLFSVPPRSNFGAASNFATEI